ncbi:MAG: efflux RND transporter periplasmic adaptor subunit, partial [Bacteroidales bacterium]|nr:efflux RND transporter periplasmic adaptor subunit [Bacteroidales bacterium]
KKAVADTTLRASFSGMIGKKFVENYQVVQAKQSIASLQKTSGLEIIVNAPENVIGRRKDTDESALTAEFANYPGERFPVTVKEFATEADPQTQTYRVVLSMSNPKDKKILSGMTATVFVEIYQSDSKTVEIPVQAVFYDEQGQAYIWKVGDDSRVTRHQVEAGMLKQDNIEIVSGLTSGDKIIIAGVQNLTDGQKVREFTGTMGE